MSAIDFFIGLMGMAGSAGKYFISVILSVPAFIIPFSIIFGTGCMYFVFRFFKR